MSIELTLQPSEILPRALALSLTASGKTLSARLLSPQDRTTLCFCIGSITDDWSLRVKDRSLWCKGAALDLSADEVSRIRRAFAIHGLPIESDFPAAAPIGPESAKVAAPAVISSSGIRGESPLPVCTDRGALEDIFEHFTARFLIAGESL